MRFYVCLTQNLELRADIKFKGNIQLEDFSLQVAMDNSSLESATEKHPNPNGFVQKKT